MIIFILATILLLAAIVAGASYFAYRIAFYSPRKDRDKTPSTSGAQYDPYREVMKLIYTQLNQRPFEEITIMSHDGLLLYGRYYHVADGAPVSIGFHGYRSSPLTDFSGGSELAFSMNQNLLLVDQRAHGRSEGSTIGFGIPEAKDCVAWVNYVISRFGRDTKILLYGISMGATTVLIASGLPLPDNVRGIVADCPYASAREIISKVSADMHIPARLAYPFVRLGAILYGGFDPDSTNAIDSVSRAKVPILLIHGEADSFVPCKMSEPIAEANPELVQRHTFPSAEHGISYLADTNRYRKIVKDFIRNVI